MTAEEEVLERVLAKAQEAATLEQVLLAVVHSLRVPLELWHAQLLRLDLSALVGRILATWSMVESVWVPDMDVPTDHTQAISDAIEHVANGEIVLMRMRADSPSLMQHALYSEGVRAAIVMPLHREADATLVLALGSATESALSSVASSFYRRLAAALGPRLLQLGGMPP